VWSLVPGSRAYGVFHADRGYYRTRLPDILEARRVRNGRIRRDHHADLRRDYLGVLVRSDVRALSGGCWYLYFDRTKSCTVCCLQCVMSELNPANPRVFLIGAGPGSPGLLTVRGAEMLSRADLVLYDQLVPQRLLDLAPPTAELVCVRDLPGQHP